jgi:hypothetical protein
MSTKIFVDNARLYAKDKDRETIRAWEKTHETNKCELSENFKSEYLVLLEYSYVPMLLQNFSKPSVFVNGATGHVLGQLLVGLLEQLSTFTRYVTPKVASEFQTKVDDFWKLGKTWEKENLTNLSGNPSNWFEKTEQYIRL